MPFVGTHGSLVKLIRLYWTEGKSVQLHVRVVVGRSSGYVSCIYRMDLTKDKYKQPEDSCEGQGGKLGVDEVATKGGNMNTSKNKTEEGTEKVQGAPTESEEGTEKVQGTATESEEGSEVVQGTATESEEGSEVV